MTRIAFLFVVRIDIKYEEVWKEFFKSMKPSQYSIYIHAKDDKDVNLSPFFKSRVIPSVYTVWGDIVLGELQLLSYALKDNKNTHFVILSETTIPLKPANFVFNEITSGETSMCLAKDPSEVWYLSDVRKEVKRKNLRKHSQFLVLSREDAELSVKHGKKLEEWGMRKPGVYADEFFFGTLLTHLGQPIQNKCYTFVNWVRSKNQLNPHTYKTISLKELLKLFKGKYLFARKFNRETQVTIDREPVGLLTDVLKGLF